MKVSKYKPTLKHSDDRLEFLMTLSDMCKLHDMKIEYNNLTLRLEDWIGVILINRTLLHPFVENLINTYK